jgi:hypothetical protein
MSEQLTKSRRQEVFELKGHECTFCGVTGEQHVEEYGRDLDIHHIVPRRADGSDSVSNLLPVCRDCHSTLEKTQGNALERIQTGSDPNADIVEQRDALLARVEYLERLIRSGKIMELATEEFVRGELVTKQFGHRATTTTDSETAREEYEEWGDSITRTSMRVTESDVKDWTNGSRYKSDVKKVLRE